ESQKHIPQNEEERVKVAETLEAAQDAMPATAAPQTTSVSESAAPKSEAAKKSASIGGESRSFRVAVYLVDELINVVCDLVLSLSM
ncbi:chemotaxis protein CheA, partial [Erwinia amylovora]|nr:chemotaxis protein CheA [Erwinia amylovora]